MIGVIACCAQKLACAAPARELYVSQLFRMSLAYAERRCEVVYIASALHELVTLDQVLRPYDFEMSDRGGKRARDAWGDRFAARLIDRHGKKFETLMLAGKLYADPISKGLYTHFGYDSKTSEWRGCRDRVLVEPLKGMQIGQRLSWLSAQLKTKEVTS